MTRRRHRAAALLSLLSGRLGRGAAALIVGLVLVVPAASAQERDGEAVPVVHLEGRGHGHGVGLSQWGAYTMALDGLGSLDIINAFYPGTSMSTIAGEVRVIVDARPSVRVSLPNGGQLRSARDGRQSQGFPIQLAPNQVVEIVHDGTGYRVVGADIRPAGSADAQRYSAAQQDDCLVLCPEPEPEPGPEPEPEPQPEPEPEPQPEPGPGECLLCAPTTPPTPTTSTTTTTAPPSPGGTAPAPGPGQAPGPGPTTTAAPPPSAPRSSTPIWAIPNAGGTVHSYDRGRTYRGSFEVHGTPDEVRIRNHVDVEHYLKGMAEVPSTWPPAAVQAQAIAARTYAMRAVAARGELCDSEACQVYVGVTRETPGQISAVEATRGQVVTYRGALASTFYSASGGGHSATVQEGFGASYDIPYLPAQPYKTDNPKEWTIDVALADVGARLQYPGTVTAVEILSTGPSGRPISMSLVGDVGVMEVDPQEFRRSLGLQSTLFRASTGVADEPPPPPPPVLDDQLSTERGSDQLAAVVDAEDRFEDPDLEDVNAQLAVAPVPETESIAAATIALLALTLGFGAATGHRLVRVANNATADGLAHSVHGAPASGFVGQLAATLSTWTHRSP